MRTSYRVPWPLRVVNLLALLLFVAGAAVYGRAWVGMQSVRTYEPPPDAPPFSAMALFNRYHELSRVGVWLVIAAVAVAILAAIAALVMRKRAAAEPEPERPPAAEPAAD